MANALMITYARCPTPFTIYFILYAFILIYSPWKPQNCNIPFLLPFCNSTSITMSQVQFVIPRRYANIINVK